MKSERGSFFWIVLCFFLSDAHGVRVRRHLIFSPGSKLFLSVDVRNNIFYYSDFFAEAVGFKLSWTLPDSVKIMNPSRNRGHTIRQRDLHRGIEHLLDQYNLNGSSCLVKFGRETETNVKCADSHWFAGLLNVIFSKKRKDRRSSITSLNFSSQETEDCHLSLSSLLCPTFST